MNNPLKAINRLLLLCVRPELTEANRQEVRSLVASIDWHDLTVQAQRHRVLPLVYQRMRSVDPPLIPGDMDRAWRQNIKRIALNNLTLTSVLFHVLGLFDNAGIEAIPYKGPVLAAMAYDNPGLRPFRDLDLMVRPQDARQALSLLKGADFRTGQYLTTMQEKALFRFGYDAEMTRSSGNQTIELHWGLTQPYFSYPFDLNSACRNMISIEVKGRSIRTFAPEYLLLVLCAHGVKHMWKRLQWVVDIAGLLRLQPAMDWVYIHAEAKRTGSLRMLHLGLALAADLIGTVLPADVQAMVQQDRALPALIDRTRHRLFNEPYDDPPIPVQIRYHLRARERRSDRLKYICRFALVPTSEDCRAVSLPFSGLYYALRPARLIKQIVGGG